MNFKKSSFNRINDPVSRLKRTMRQDNELEDMVRMNAGGNNFFENFGDEVEV